MAAGEAGLAGGVLAPRASAGAGAKGASATARCGGGVVPRGQHAAARWPTPRPRRSRARCFRSRMAQSRQAGPPPPSRRWPRTWHARACSTPRR
eukprot:7381406-Prymnesium_polylepis.2